MSCGVEFFYSQMWAICKERWWQWKISTSGIGVSSWRGCWVMADWICQHLEVQGWILGWGWPAPGVLQEGFVCHPVQAEQELQHSSVFVATVIFQSQHKMSLSWEGLEGRRHCCCWERWLWLTELRCHCHCIPTSLVKVHEHSVRPNCSVGLFRGIFRLKRVWLYSSFTLTPVLRQQWNDAALLPSRQQNKTSFCSVEQRKSSQIVLQWQQIPTNMVQMQTEVSAGKDDWDEQGQTASHACRTMELPGGTSPSHSVQCTGTVLSFSISHFPGLLWNLSLLYHAMTTILSTFKRLCSILKSQMNR